MFYKLSSLLFPLCIIIGVVLGFLYFYKKIKQFDFDKKTSERLIIIICYAGIAFYLGARFFDDLFHFLNNEPWGKGGITFLGGCLSALIVFGTLFFFFLKEKRMIFFKLMNIIVAAICLGHAFGRIGCFCAGCCYGAVTESPIGITFPGEGYQYYGNGRYTVSGSPAYMDLFEDYLDRNAFDYAIEYGTEDDLQLLLEFADDYASKTKLIPTQLIEAAFLLILFFILANISKHQTVIYMIAYGVYRIFAETLRNDNRGSIGLSISPAQFLSIFMILMGIALFILYIYLNKKKKMDI